MRTQEWIAVCVVLVMIAACQGKNEAALSGGDIEAIKATQEKYIASVVAEDWTKSAETLTADALMMPADREPISGRDAIVAWVKSLPKTTAFAFPSNEVSGSGDTAYGVGTYKFTSMLPDGQTVSGQGVRTEIFRRQADGGWLISRAIHHPMDRNGATTRAEDESHIRDLIKDVEAMINRRDFESEASLFTDDGDLVVLDRPAVKGRSAVAAELAKGWEAEPTCRIALHNDELRFLNPDTVLLNDHATLTGCRKIGPGRDTTILIRKEGKWQWAALRIYQVPTK